MKLRRDLDKRFLAAGVNLLLGIGSLYLYNKTGSLFSAAVSLILAGVVLGQLDSIIRELRGK